MAREKVSRDPRRKPVLGVLGGMGALASAEFVKSVYEACPTGPEQDAPVLVLYSDPTFPDRTETLLHGGDDELLARLIEGLTRLRALGASRIVICCMTLHHLLPRLAQEVRETIISLPDVVFEHVRRRSGKHLLVCSTGARKLQIFQKHEAWDACKDHVLLPDEDDQEKLHQMLYELKANRGFDRTITFIESMLSKYRVDSFIVGCSEIHMVAKRMTADGRSDGVVHPSSGLLDPLAIIARSWAEGRMT